MPDSLKILISSGELSGSLHAAELVKKISTALPNASFFGMGLSPMQEAGVKIIVDAKTISVFGGVSVIKNLAALRRAWLTMKKALIEEKPKLIILVDYPGFNLPLAKLAKKLGIKVVYYISPKIWAWNLKRIKAIQKSVDLMAVIFPFEVKFYQNYQVPAAFVGNPSLASVDKYLANHSLETNSCNTAQKQHRTIGLFPGSRHSEIKRLLPVLIEAAMLLKQQDPTVEFILPKASCIDDSIIKPYLANKPISVTISTNPVYSLIRSCDAIVAASGTVTLEIALMEVPFIIVYKLSWLEYQLAKRLIKIPYAGLCNILSNRELAPELLQNDANADKIAKTLNQLINDSQCRQKMIRELKELRKLLEHEPIIELTTLISRLVTT